MLDDHGDHFINRCFTAAEREHAEAAKAARAQRYAARFAGKEAILKALGTGLTRGIGWQDMEIGVEPSGRPVVGLSGRCAEVAAELGITQWHISLTHTASLATASVLACGSAAS